MDMFLIAGLISLALMITMLFVSDFEIPLGDELAISVQGTLLGITFLSFVNYYIQSYTTSSLLLTISGIVFFIIGYNVFTKLFALLKSGETGDVHTRESLLFKKGNILNSFEKNNEFYYEVSLDNNTYIAKSNEKLDEAINIIVSEINNDEIIIINDK